MTLLEEIEKYPEIRSFHAVSSGSIAVMSLILHRCSPSALAAMRRLEERHGWWRLCCLFPVYIRVLYRTWRSAFDELEGTMSLSELDAEVSRLDLHIYANDAQCRRVHLRPRTWPELKRAVESSCNIPVINPTVGEHWDGVWVGHRDVALSIRGSYLEISFPPLPDFLRFVLLAHDVRCRVRAHPASPQPPTSSPGS